MSLTFRASWTRDMSGASIDRHVSMHGVSSIHSHLSMRGMMVKRTMTLVASATTQCCPSVLAAPLSAVDATELASGFSALSDPVRLRVLSILAASPDGEVCVCEFVEPLG